jgi:hypothetical protein
MLLLGCSIALSVLSMSRTTSTTQFWRQVNSYPSSSDSGPSDEGSRTGGTDRVCVFSVSHLWARLTYPRKAAAFTLRLFKDSTACANMLRYDDSHVGSPYVIRTRRRYLLRLSSAKAPSVDSRLTTSRASDVDDDRCAGHPKSVFLELSRKRCIRRTAQADLGYLV